MLKTKILMVALGFGFTFLVAPSSASAGPILQWATSAEAQDYYSDSFLPSFATGEPDATGCDERNEVWATQASNAVASITLSYETAVVPTSIKVYQNNVVGAISKIEVALNDGAWTQVYTGDPLLAVDGTCGSPHDRDADRLAVPISSNITTTINRIRITVDQRTNGWAEIDAVQLVSDGRTVGKSAQSGAKIAGSLKKGKSLTLPSQTEQGIKLTWTTSTKKICSIKAGKLKGLKKGICKVSASNAGNSMHNKFTYKKTVSIK